VRKFELLILALTTATLVSIGVAAVHSLEAAYSERLCSCVEAGPMTGVER